MTEQQTRGSRLSIIYDRIVLGHPLLSIAFCCLITAWLSTYIPTMKLDASADSLVLEGDTALEYFRETGARYSSDEFLLVAYQPNGDLLSDEVLDNLRVLRNELTELEGVSSVVSILDVPLLNSPRIDLSEITSSGGVPTLETPGIDRKLQATARAQALQHALQTLPDRQRQAMILRHIEDLSNPEISDIMEISVEAVESLVSRGKRALASTLAPQRKALGLEDD